MRADPVERAVRVVEGLPEVAGVRIRDGALSIAAAPSSAAAINRSLMEADVAVSELRSERASLEEVFLALTRDEEDGSR